MTTTSETTIPPEHAAGLLRSWMFRQVIVSVDAMDDLTVSVDVRGDVCEVEAAGDDEGGIEWVEIRSDSWTVKAKGIASIGADANGNQFELKFNHEARR